MLACRRQVCPRPERKYEAQIGLREMEGQAIRTALVQHKTLAKRALDALASRAETHVAHLRSPVAVMNCTLCRTSTAGIAVMDWVRTVTSTHPAAPYPIRSPVQTSRASGCLGDSPLENTTEVSPESPREFVRWTSEFVSTPGHQQYISVERCALPDGRHYSAQQRFIY